MARGPVNLPRDFNPRDPVFKKFANKLPTRQTCDLDDPKQMFVWMLVAPPGMNGGQQAMPTSYNMLVSQHLWECGAMLKCPECGHTREPQKVYVPPESHDPHWLTSPGRWVRPQDAPQQTGDPLDKTLDALTAAQQASLLQRLLKRREAGDL